jgi:hypothetical protein
MKRLLLLPALLGLAGCHYLEIKESVAAPPPVVAAPVGPVTLHLATFREPYQKDESWFRITRDYPEVGQYPPRVGIVPDVAYSRIYELYVDGVPGDVAANLCTDMMAHDQYCAIQLAASPPPAGMGITSDTTTTTILVPPPVGSAPAP